VQFENLQDAASSQSESLGLHELNVFLRNHVVQHTDQTDDVLPKSAVKGLYELCQRVLQHDPKLCAALHAGVEIVMLREEIPMTPRSPDEWETAEAAFRRYRKKARSVARQFPTLRGKHAVPSEKELRSLWDTMSTNYLKAHRRPASAEMIEPLRQEK